MERQELIFKENGRRWEKYVAEGNRGEGGKDEGKIWRVDRGVG